MIRTALLALVAALTLVGGPSVAQSMGGLTIGEPAPMAPISQRPYADSFPDDKVLPFYPDTCALEFEMNDGTPISAFAAGCDGPILELQRASQTSAQDTSTPDITTLTPFFGFGKTTLADVTNLLGGQGTLISDFGITSRIPVNRLLYRIQDTDTFLVFWFDVPDWEPPYEPTPEIYAGSVLTNIALVDAQFFSARYFGTAARVPERRIEDAINVFAPDG